MELMLTSLASGPAIYKQALFKLVESSYIKPSTLLSHVSPRDKRIRYEQEEKAKIAGFPTAKQLRETKEIALGRIRREEEEAEKIGLVGCLSFTHKPKSDLRCAVAETQNKRSPWRQT